MLQPLCSDQLFLLPYEKDISFHPYRIVFALHRSPFHIFFIHHVERERDCDLKLEHMFRIYLFRRLMIICVVSFLYDTVFFFHKEDVYA